jgi:phage terminase large subunit-like protein
MAKTDPQLDPVTRYATDVAAGAIVACRLVRLACRRHLDDLARATEKGLVWRPDEAQRAMDFFPVILRLPENVDAGDELADEDVDGAEPQRFDLAPYQSFIVGSIFGWHTVKGFRRFRTAYIETGKGSGKTPLAAGLMIYKALADGERRAQVYFAATKLDQAKIPFADVEAMVQASPSLRSGCSRPSTISRTRRRARSCARSPRRRRASTASACTGVTSRSCTSTRRLTSCRRCAPASRGGETPSSLKRRTPASTGSPSAGTITSTHARC